MGKKLAGTWRIEGFDSLDLIYQKDVPVGVLGEKQVQQLLKALVAKAGLDFNEIVGAYAKRGTKLSNNLLSVRRDGPDPTFSCGENPYFTASIIRDQRIQHEAPPGSSGEPLGAEDGSTSLGNSPST